MTTYKNLLSGDTGSVTEIAVAAADEAAGQGIESFSLEDEGVEHCIALDVEEEIAAAINGFQPYRGIQVTETMLAHAADFLEYRHEQFNAVQQVGISHTRGGLQGTSNLVAAGEGGVGISLTRGGLQGPNNLVAASEGVDGSSLTRGGLQGACNLVAAGEGVTRGGLQGTNLVAAGEGGVGSSLTRCGLQGTSNLVAASEVTENVRHGKRERSSRGTSIPLRKWGSACISSADEDKGIDVAPACVSSGDAVVVGMPARIGIEHCLVESYGAVIGIGNVTGYCDLKEDVQVQGIWQALPEVAVTGDGSVVGVDEDLVQARIFCPETDAVFRLAPDTALFSTQLVTSFLHCSCSGMVYAKVREAFTMHHNEQLTLPPAELASVAQGMRYLLAIGGEGMDRHHAEHTGIKYTAPTATQELASRCNSSVVRGRFTCGSTMCASAVPF